MILKWIHLTWKSSSDLSGGVVSHQSTGANGVLSDQSTGASGDVLSHQSTGAGGVLLVGGFMKCVEGSPIADKNGNDRLCPLDILVN